MNNEPEYLSYHNRNTRRMAQALLIIVGGVLFFFLILWCAGA